MASLLDDTSLVLRLLPDRLFPSDPLLVGGNFPIILLSFIFSISLSRSSHRPCAKNTKKKKKKKVFCIAVPLEIFCLNKN